VAALRIGIVGSRFAAHLHLAAYRRVYGVEARLAGVTSPTAERREAFARESGATAYPSLAAMLPHVDVVDVCAPPAQHEAAALEAIEAGKHVFVEKPMALTEAECRTLTRAVRDSNRQFTVGFNRRFSPFYIEQKRALAGRATPGVLNCRVSSPGISGSYWMADPSIGGAILGDACHFVDLMSWLLDSEPFSVTAYCLPTAAQEPVGENNMAASFRFADGSVGNLTYCTMGGTSAAAERVEAFVPGLGVRVENFKRLAVDTRLRRRRRSQWWPDKGYTAQLRAFLTGIRSGVVPAVGVRDGARATLACLRMLESARTLAPRAIDLDAVLD